MTVYLEGQTDTHKYFSCINSIQTLAINKQFNSKQQSHVTDFFM